MPCATPSRTGFAGQPAAIPARTLNASPTGFKPEPPPNWVIASGARVGNMWGEFVRGRELVAIGADGVRKHGDPTPITVDDRMHLGSCTKAMTATPATPTASATNTPAPAGAVTDRKSVV